MTEINWYETSRKKFPPEHLLDEHIRLVRLLDALVTNGRATKSLWSELRRLASSISIGGMTITSESVGSFSVWPQLQPNSVSQWYALTLIELIAQGLDDRVRRCGLESCRIFFVDGNFRGPRKRYCSAGHGSQVRVKRKRKADQKRRLS